MIAKRLGAIAVALGVGLLLPGAAQAYVLFVDYGRERPLLLQRDGATRPERRLASGVSGPTIAPGGAALAYTRGATSTVLTLADGRARRIRNPSGGDLQLSADGSRALLEGVDRITFVGGSRRRSLGEATFTEAFSPDGRRVAAFDDDGLRIVATDTGAVSRVRAPADQTFFGVAWTAAGLVLGVAGEPQRVEVLGLDGVRRPLARVNADTFDLGPVSRDGRLVVLSRISESREVAGLATLDVTTGGVRRLRIPARGTLEPVGFCEDASCLYHLNGNHLERFDLVTGASRLVRRDVVFAVAG